LISKSICPFESGWTFSLLRSSCVPSLNGASTEARAAGFEWAAGFYIDPTPPDRAAEYLLNVDLSSPARS